MSNLGDFCELVLTATARFSSLNDWWCHEVLNTWGGACFRSVRTSFYRFFNLFARVKSCGKRSLYKVIFNLSYSTLHIQCVCVCVRRATVWPSLFEEIKLLLDCYDMSSSSSFSYVEAYHRVWVICKWPEWKLCFFQVFRIINNLL